MSASESHHKHLNQLSQIDRLLVQGRQAEATALMLEVAMRHGDGVDWLRHVPGVELLDDAERELFDRSVEQVEQVFLEIGRRRGVVG